MFFGVARHVNLEDEDGFYTKGCREALAYAVQEQNKKVDISVIDAKYCKFYPNLHAYFE